MLAWVLLLVSTLMLREKLPEVSWAVLSEEIFGDFFRVILIFSGLIGLMSSQKMRAAKVVPAAIQKIVKMYFRGNVGVRMMSIV